MIPILTRRSPGRSIIQVLSAGLLLATLPSGAAPATPYRGLWVGQVVLNYANEVSVPLNSNNIPIAPDPQVPTPTRDAANLRLILHVSGSGQVTLLKDVAVLNRANTNSVLKSESDVALVTDETLYGNFPPQPAVRVGSAAFDFGDSKATEAVDAVLEAVVNAVAQSVQTNTVNLSTSGGRAGAENTATAAGTAAAAPIIANADVALAFENFLAGTNLNAAAVDRLASSNAPIATAALNTAYAAATNLQKRSFFNDTRAVEMVLAVSNAVRSAASGVARTNTAQNTAASFADLANAYNRFIAGKIFGDMIVAAANAAATAAAINTATSTSISNAVNASVTVNAARAEAIAIKIVLYRDTRGSDAVEQVVSSIMTNAIAFLSNTNRTVEIIRASAEQTGRETLGSRVARYPIASQPPTGNYNDFVRSAFFQTNAQTAAHAAALAAVVEKLNNSLIAFDPEPLKREAKIAAVIALEDVYAAAARAVRNELPMAGIFSSGVGDPRLTWAMKQTNAAASLGPPALTGTIRLPASHPTNPFRHRRHPDHTTGFDVTRNLRLDFNTNAPGGLPRSGFGVNRITGTYREEIFGLHKPLGPQRDTGLRVEGTFQLDRISLIDTLNAR